MEYLREFKVELPKNEALGAYDSTKIRKEFLANLKSYNYKRWSDKPLLLYPNICSLFGWRCSNSKENMLVCNKCQAVIFVNLPAHNLPSYAVEVTKYYEMLSTKHESTCAYRESHMSQDMLFLPAVDGQTCLKSILLDFNAAKHEALSVIFHPKFEDKMEQYDNLIDWILRKAIQDSPSRNDKKVMLLILTGWEIRPKHKLECKNCFRLLGLWNYNADTEPEPKRLTKEEWAVQRDNFVMEFSRVNENVEYPAQEAEKDSGDENDEPKRRKSDTNEVNSKKGREEKEEPTVTDITLAKDGLGMPSLEVGSDEISSPEKSDEATKKPDLNPLSEHYPWCSWVFAGMEVECQDSQPCWLQRVECLNELMVRDQIPRKHTKLVSVGTMLDAALNPMEMYK